MKWRPEYATGIEQVDDQHRAIFKVADDFEVELDAGLGEHNYRTVLDFLNQYVRAHFGFEETCMARYHCPAAQQNERAHAQFITVINDFTQRFTDHGYVAADASALTSTVNQWLDRHICTIDTRLKDSVQSGT